MVLRQSKLVRAYALLSMLFISVTSFAGMSVDELHRLSILQKIHHEKPGSEESKEFLSRYSEVLKSYEIEVTEELAKPYFNGQPEIPFVLFKAKTTDLKNPAPLIIHTHGGPKVLVKPDVAHAEIAYYLANGYTVACPNYRGSDFPIGHPLYFAGKISRKEHQIIGPEDVYAVADFMKAKHYVKQDLIFLRGGSFGSFINAHLVAAIHSGKMPQIFAGLHLSGGVDFPSAKEFPNAFPILISHGNADSIAPFSDAYHLMDGLLSNRKKVQVYVGEGADHHLVDPSYKHLREYLEISTHFLNTLAEGQTLNFDTPETQLKAIKKYSGMGPIQGPRDAVTDWVEDRTRTSKKKSPSLPRLVQNNVNGTTMAHLKLVLGKDFKGDVKADFRTYLESYFKPMDWDTKLPVSPNPGERMINDRDFLQQMIEAVETEQRVVSQDPNTMTLYHTAELSALHLYAFLGLWKSTLRGKPLSDLKTLNEFRLWDLVSSSTDNIQNFLLGIRRKNRFSPNEIFNNTPGFADRALSCNAGLTFNRHTTASSSLWWYFNSKDANPRTPLKETVIELLKDLGIYSAERAQRYMRIFESERIELEKKGLNQTAMIQFFLPYSLAKELSYVSQLWGAEYKENNMDLANPEIFKDFNSAPETFEERLRQNSSAFTNLGDYKYFGDIKSGFLYADTLQIRFLQTPPQKYKKQIKTKVFFRRPEMFQNLVSKLAALVAEDYAEYLRGDNIIPDYLVHGAETATRQARQELSIQAKESISDEVYVRLQKELRSGLVQDPYHPAYSETFKNMSREQKASIQAQLKGVKMEGRNIFALCTYIKGYTYYDLLVEHLDKKKTQTLTKYPDLARNYAHIIEEIHETEMDVISRFSKMDSAFSEDISGGAYHQFYNSTQNLIDDTPYVRGQYEYIQPDGLQYYEDRLFHAELWTAVNSVRVNAKLAKERGYGHHIE